VGPPQDRRRTVVPIVPAAAVFDLGRGGDPRARPDAALGREAVEAAAGPAGAAVPARGCVGAGTGAVLAGGTLKGGVGTASVRLPGGVVVAALAVVNAFGSPLDRTTGALLGTAFVPPGLVRPAAPGPRAAALIGATIAAGPAGPGRPAVPPALNTTLAVVATNADLDPARTRRAATAAHAGLARALDPAHTLLDGDTVFALATGEVPVGTEEHVAIHAAAATALTLAVMDGVLTATGVRTPGLDVPAYADLVGAGG
jgi:putative pantetheine hydrolase